MLDAMAYRTEIAPHTGEWAQYRPLPFLVWHGVVYVGMAIPPRGTQGGFVRCFVNRVLRFDNVPAPITTPKIERNPNMTIKKTIPDDEPLTKSQAMSLRRPGIKLTPAQRAVLEGLTDAERTRMEDSLTNLTPEFVRKLEGLTPAEVRRLLVRGT